MMVVEEGKKELLITLDEDNISGISRSFFYLILLKYNFSAKSLGGEFGVATTAGECRHLKIFNIIFTHSWMNLMQFSSPF